MEALRTAEVEKDALLSDLGINVNLAPVCDITTDPAAFLYDRSLGQSPELTCQWVQIAVEEGQTYGIGCVLKHFPGYGNNADTHVGDCHRKSFPGGTGSPGSPALCRRNGGRLRSRHGVPHSGHCTGCGIPCIPVPGGPPLCPGKPWAITVFWSQMTWLWMQFLFPTASGEAAVLAVLAGNDLLISSDFPEQYAAVLEAIREGRISEEQIDNAVRRILLWKQFSGAVVRHLTVSG